MEEMDLEVYPNLIWAAFKDDLMQIMYPNGYPQASREQTTRESIAKWRKHPEKIHWNKVIDTDLPADDPGRQMVGVAHYDIHPTARTTADLDAEDAEKGPEDPDPAMNRAFCDEFFGDIKRIRRETMGGKPYVLLHMLATHPDHHRRGVGAMQLEWGSKKAEEMGVECYLESSPIGRPLYEKHGYVKVGDLPLDARGHGHEKDLPHVVMIRPAKGSGGKIAEKPAS